MENDFKNIEDDDDLLNLSESIYKNYLTYMNNQEIDKAIKEIFDLLTQTNIYIDKHQPWNLKKTDIKRMNNVLSVAVELIKRSTFLLFPIIPDSCNKIFNILNIDNEINFFNYNKISNKSHTINKPSPVFPKIELDD